MHNEVKRTCSVNGFVACRSMVPLLDTIGHTCVCKYRCTYKSNLTRHQHNCWWHQKQERAREAAEKTTQRRAAARSPGFSEGSGQNRPPSAEEPPRASASQSVSYRSFPPARASQHLSSSGSSSYSRSQSLSSEESSSCIPVQRRNATYPVPDPTVFDVPRRQIYPPASRGHEYNQVSFQNPQSHSAHENHYFGAEAPTTDSPSSTQPQDDFKLYHSSFQCPSGHPETSNYPERVSPTPVISGSPQPCSPSPNGCPPAPEPDLRRHASHDGVRFCEAPTISSLDYLQRPNDISLTPAPQTAHLQSYDPHDRHGTVFDGSSSRRDFGDGFARLSLTDSILPHDGLRRNALVPSVSPPDTGSMMLFSFPPSTTQSSDHNTHHFPTVGYSVETPESWISFIRDTGIQNSSLLDTLSAAPPAHSNAGYHSEEINDQWALWTPPESPNGE